MPEWRDDLTIEGDECLWRRILIDDPSQIKKDAITGELRPSSAAFKSKTMLTSVDLASLTTLRNVVSKYPKHSIVSVTARAVREAGCIVVRDPNSDNVAHAHIINPQREDGYLTGAQAKKIANHATWVRYLATEN